MDRKSSEARAFETARDWPDLERDSADARALRLLVATRTVHDENHRDALIAAVKSRVYELLREYESFPVAVNVLPDVARLWVAARDAEPGSPWVEV